MPIFTRRIHRYRKHRTPKKGGSRPYDERKGIIDIASDKLSNAASSIVNKAEDIGLNTLGLEKINNPTNNYVEKANEHIGNVVSNVKNTVEQSSTAAINSVNEVLGSEAVTNSVEEAAKTTAEISGKLAESFNDAMNDPVIKQELEEAIENASEIGEVIVKSSEEPFKEAVKVGVEAGTDAVSAASSGIVKVGTDMMAAVPGVGAIIEFGKILNDGSKAASAVIEASSKAISTASDAFITTTENVKQGLKELEEKKKMAEQISKRTTQSINSFENPLPTAQRGGGRKTRRRLLKRKTNKSKSVRFVI
jgi:ABC-type transporter Mla subunit MlaD